MTARFVKLIQGSTFCLLVAFLGPAFSQGYPSRPVKIVVPFTPGGIVDTTARAVSIKLQERLGQAFVVENKPGAGGIIGIESVRNSAPDGYTILTTPSSMTAHAAIMRAPKFDPAKDFTHITIAVASPFVIVVNPKLEIRSLRDLIRYSRANPGKLTYSSPGVGTNNYLTTEYFKAAARLDLLHIPYKGSAESIQAVASGEVDLSFQPIVGTKALIEAGKLRVLAVTSKDRMPQMPKVPSATEEVPEFQNTQWVGFAVPAGTPAIIVAALNREISAIVQTAEYSESMAQQSTQAVGNSVEEAGNFVRSEADRWNSLVRTIGMNKQE